MTKSDSNLNANDFVFKKKSIEQLKQNYNSRVKKDKNGFRDFIEFNDWYENEDKTCFYCGIKEIEMQKIVVLGLLNSNRFPLDGITKQGRARGMWLEVDRVKPNDVYSNINCVLACYFCNNDKSDVFDGNEYLKFYQDRASYLRNLLNK